LADAGVTVFAVEKDLSLPVRSSTKVSRIFDAPDFTEQHMVPAPINIRARLTAYSLAPIHERPPTN
jgi:hypothetical protein